MFILVCCSFLIEAYYSLSAGSFLILWLLLSVDSLSFQIKFRYRTVLRCMGFITAYFVLFSLCWLFSSLVHLQAGLRVCLLRLLIVFVLGLLLLKGFERLCPV